jgi:hypothetical protein
VVVLRSLAILLASGSACQTVLFNVARSCCAATRSEAFGFVRSARRTLRDGTPELLACSTDRRLAQGQPLTELEEPGELQSGSNMSRRSGDDQTVRTYCVVVSPSQCVRIRDESANAFVPRSRKRANAMGFRARQARGVVDAQLPEQLS